MDRHQGQFLGTLCQVLQFAEIPAGVSQVFRALILVGRIVGVFGYVEQDTRQSDAARIQYVVDGGPGGILHSEFRHGQIAGDI